MINKCVISDKHGKPIKVFTKNEVDIYCCNSCGSIMADVDFHHEQYENDSYYTMHHESKEMIDYQWGFRWRYILHKIKVIAGNSTLIDVGAGNGYFIYLATNEFHFDSKGIEISKKEIEYAKRILGVDIELSTIEEVSENFNVITCFNVVEHVKNPSAFIDQMKSLLFSGGYLVITTPNPSSIHCLIQGGLEKWWLVNPPHHINLFTKRALNEILTEKGLTVVHYETLSTYIKRVRRFDSKGLILSKAFFHILRAVNLGLDHFFIARLS